MAVESLGNFYRNNHRYGLSSLGSPGTSDSGGAPSFSGLLDRENRRIRRLGQTPGGGEPSQGQEVSAGERPAGLEAALPEEKPAGPEMPEPGRGLSSRKPVIDKTGKLYEQCEALETFLVKTLITGMRNTIQKSEFLDGGFAGGIYEDMLYDEYAGDFAKNANFGLAELAYLELTGQRGKLLSHP
jgi:flagellar protein FlgJ